MPGISGIEKFGNHLAIRLEDGSRILGYNTGKESWIVSDKPIDDGTVTPAPGTGPQPIRELKNDYPWPNGPVNSISPLGFGYRECVDFVAWRMNRDMGVTSSPWGFKRATFPPFPDGNGDAIGWKSDWQGKGWQVDLPPVPGRVGWYGSKAGAYGHVNYVQSVLSNGSIVVEEFNWGGTHSYGTRTISSSAGSAYPDSFLQAWPG